MTQTSLPAARIWRADHGAGAGGWTGDQSATGLVVNGANVETTVVSAS